MKPVKLNTLKTTPESKDVQSGTTQSKKPRKKRVEVTPDLVTQMVRLHAEGYTNKDIAELLNVSSPTVGRHLSQNHKLPRRRMTGAERARIVTMREGGASYGKIAKDLHCSVSCVRRIYREELGEIPTRATERVNRVAEQDRIEITPIHRIGNELHNVDVHEPVAENDVPMVHPEKVETTNAVLWMMLAGVVFILGMAVANV